MSNTENRRAGKLYVKIDGQIQEAKGEFTLTAGGFKRKTIMGADGKPQGFTEDGIVPKVEGALTDKASFDIEKIYALDNSTITIELNNGKTFVLKEAWWAGDNTHKTQEGEIALIFEGKEGSYI